MSRHEGVSCDSCLKGNFRGRRYKCLICYDYDLCATCYESGATTARHTTDHPMQCILTRTDFDLYYGGETLSADQPQSFTCPYCSKMGLTEQVLLDHVTSEHADSSAEVVCPVCAALPSGDPNYVTDDFAAHLTLEHRAPRELEEPVGGIRHVRRIPHPGRGVGGSRTRRTNMHFQSAGSTLSGLAPNSRETMDPIAELLSQLSSVRSRAAAAQSVSSQLQQLEMQLQTTRQQLERLPRRQGAEATRSTANGSQAPILDFAGAVSTGNNNNSTTSSGNTNTNSQFLLARYGEPDLSEVERQELEVDRADRGAFIQELLLSSLAEGLRLDCDDGEGVSSQLFSTQYSLDVHHEGSVVVSTLESQSNSAGSGSALHNGPSNDVIIHAPSPQCDTMTSGHDNHDNVLKHSKEVTTSERNSKAVGGGGGSGRESNTPPPKNAH